MVCVDDENVKVLVATRFPVPVDNGDTTYVLRRYLQLGETQYRARGKRMENFA
jgi:hypothetical protein